MNNSHVTDTDYGYRKVSREEKYSLVRHLFSRVSGRYDLMNNLMSLGLHHCWKKKFIQQFSLFDKARVIDVAAGTGDISLNLHQTFPYLNLTTYLVDPTKDMLDISKKKAFDHGICQGIEWYVDAAESLPFPSETMDIYCISFGLRNVVDRQKALQEAYRVLKPGGKFYCLEFSHMDDHLLNILYDFYSFKFLPTLGAYVANDREAYQYLVESIRCFPKRLDLESEICDVGFEQVLSESWFKGLVAFHTGSKV